METTTFLQILALGFGFYMAWNIGANDVANAMGTSVGSKALSLKRACFLAALLEFCGAFFAGGAVSQTIQQGIVIPEVFSLDPMIFVMGMLGSLLATGLLLQIASYFGLPISTTHAIVGSVIGFGWAIGGFQAIYWKEVLFIGMSWIFSPILSGLFSYLLFLWIQRKVLFTLNPLYATERLAPYFVFSSIFILCLSFFYQGALNTSLSFLEAFFLSVLVGVSSALFSKRFFKIKPAELQLSEGFHPSQAVSLEKALHHLQRVHLSNRSPAHSEEISLIVTQVKALSETVKKELPFESSHSHYLGVERTFVYLQILSACLVAFAHGTNDVANAIGPVAAILTTLKTQVISSQSAVPSWLLGLGGLGIVVGLATWGWRVIETVGKKITELTPTRGFAAEFGAAATILTASKLGLPISTTHALVGSVLGVGLARGLPALNLQTLKEIVLSWLATIPLSAGLSILCFYLLKFFFL